ncbi:MAG: ABC transporter substrate-binding protein, partial [Planctomycetota bacterium]|nr:ABC transporter substrate-binding protein [Planctomycetota bacterium]
GFDPQAARAALAAAVPGGGATLPELVLVYNVSETHRAIATFVAAQWRTHLGVRVRLRPLGWEAYKARRDGGDFAVARAGWVGDLPDPSGFLALFETGRQENVSAWSHAPYDDLLARARGAVTPAERLALLRTAEQMLLTEGVPCVPLFWYRLGDLVQPHVRGFRTRAVGAAPEVPGVHNVQGLHPFRGLWIEHDTK